MAKSPRLTLNPTEAASASVKTNLKVVTVTDELGRKIVVRKLNALNKVDLAEVVGAERCENEAVIGPCAVAYSVSEIDGEQVFPPNSWSEMRVLLGRLDDEGIAAATMAHIDHFGVVPESMDEASDALKNS